ncbi:IS3 family transposase [Pectobacterium sp. A5351]|uniref:IS3 family transposase n=1 Tax=Pectobacterium sp. A5351 TaxID=2914983 RepID=UPI00232B663C|nr:IS3 family transposase [Pectobacterium sp. A5351]WCG83508.1 IS3 family transposase [Pectobacterium sp. A5351]
MLTPGIHPTEKREEEMESFYRTLKAELMRGSVFVSREQVMNAIFDDIEVFYNCRCKHSMGYQTPVDDEMAA